MITIHATIPDELAQRVSDAAERAHTSLDQVVAEALAAHVRARELFEDISVRAARADGDAFRRILDSVPDRPPMPGDEL